MKWHAIIVLLEIGISIAIPPSFSVASEHGNHAMIGNLDVCHPSAPALSANGGMPCVHQRPCGQLPLVQDKNVEIVNPLFKPLLISFQEEHPPKS